MPNNSHAATPSTISLSSLQAFSLAGGVPVQIIRRGLTTGFVYEDSRARIFRLGAVLPTRLGASREDQCREVLETADGMLSEAGFRFSDTVRTWFYLDHLLDWYAGFNKVRTDFFQSRGVFDRLVPASTGIGAANAWGAALTCDLLAIVRKADSLSVSAVPSPMQESALNYKSSFSRAVEIRTSGFRQLLISGTASIDKEGLTVHQGDTGAQVELTMKVVEALLASRGMGWDQVTRGIAYFKSRAEQGLLDQWFASHRVTPFPLAFVEADICRHDLNYEIEIDAVAS
jgi:enamine deaminase RidA (YjgF/YER057c/UK114 family)